jgi:ribose/xylose/arabinose/galactoside ABC-type transport system permease subunit
MNTKMAWELLRKARPEQLNRFGLAVAIAIIVLVLSFISPYFLTTENIISVLSQIAIVGILACGTTVVLIGGGIDLSNADQLVLFSCLFAILIGPHDTGLPVALITPLAGGLCVGLVIGSIIARLGFPPLLTTLGMLFIIRGLTMVTTGFSDIKLTGDTSFHFIGSGKLGPIPMPVVILAIVAALTWFLLSRTNFGSMLYAIGGSEPAARLAGIRIARIKTISYIVSSLCAVIGGILLTSQLEYASPRYGQLGDFLLGSLAAAIIGGTSLKGGKGSIVGTMLGAVLIGIIANALALLNVPGYYHLIVVGSTVLLAAGLDTMLQRGETKP